MALSVIFQFVVENKRVPRGLNLRQVLVLTFLTQHSWQLAPGWALGAQGLGG